MRKNIALQLFSLLFLCLCLPVASYSQQNLGEYSRAPRQKVELNQDWGFYLEENQGDVLALTNDTINWQRVSVPHSLELVPADVSGLDSVYQTTFHRKVGWYKKNISITESADKKIFLEFEGVHQVTNLWVNGKHVGEHAIGGYTPFHFDISDFVKRNGEPNKILLSADNRLNASIPPDGNQYDYIKFSGLYRDVYLVVTDPVHVTFPWEALDAGVFVTTPTVSPKDATINIKTTIRNESDTPQHTSLISRIVDAEGLVVCKIETTATIPAGVDHTFSQVGGITENVKLWSPEKPYLYRVHTSVFKADSVVDQVENPLGIRKLEYVRDKGLLINGELIELVGANRHQAYPFIGDAVPNSLHWKDAWQFKQAGFNVVRLAHYPHDNSFIEACDELGILVYEEPPSWIGIGGDAWFENLETATRRMVRNHRNHPSILMWGGSLNHRGPVPQLHYACKQEDPTRMTASNGSPWSGPRNSGVTDIYAPMDYQNMDLNPDEFIFLCEHGSAADASRNQFEVSKARASANHLGVAVWTAHDYQSFKPNRGLYPRRIFSMYREPNPVYYWYQSELLNSPMVYIADPDVSETAEVLVFSNCEKVQLYQDGILIATQTPDHNSDRLHINHPSFTFNYDWQLGKLTAKGLQNGKVVAEYETAKATAPYQLKLVFEDDNRPFKASGYDIKMVKAYIQDKAGNRIKNDSTKVTFSVKGAGKLVGNEEIGANPNQAYRGVASGLIKSTTTAGNIRIKAMAKGLKSSEVSITTVTYQPIKTIQEGVAFREIKEAKIDLGGDVERLLQFGWTEWNPSLLPKVPDFPNLKLAVKGSGADLEWMNGWGLSSDLAFVGTDGLRATQKEQIVLTIEGLKEGTYLTTSYHHLMNSPDQLNGRFEISVSSNGIKQNLTLVPSTGNRLGQDEPASLQYEMYSDGENAITITIADNEGELTPVLNGLKIREK
ncbi:DUF4982 domain-containing protein [Maribacter sp.]|nr:DUF4982 domain-containing protein [Maribacter sp.]